MWGHFRRRLTQTFSRVNLRTYLNSECFNPIQFQFRCAAYTARIISSPLKYPKLSISRSSFTSSIHENRNLPAVKPDDESNVDENSESNEDDDDDENPNGQYGFRDQGVARDVATILDILREPGSSRPQVKETLERCSVTASSELVVEVLSRVRNDWESSFIFFIWAAHLPCVNTTP
ncbi:hypothetical protein U1Q18_018651 [Sarracenia purpurea var. burkii]